MKNEHPYGARRECRRRTLRTRAAQPQTARHGGSAKVRSAHPAAPVANIEGELSATPTARAQTARHGGSVEGSRGVHADGETRHRASSRRLHRTISPWRGVGSRGATVGRPSAHCASPGRHSGPRSSPPDRAPPRAQAVRGRGYRWAQRASPDARSEQPAWRKANPPQAPTHRAPPRAHPTQSKA